MMKLSTFERVASRWLRQRVCANYHLYDSGCEIVLLANSNRAFRMLDSVVAGLERRLSRTARATRKCRSVRLRRWLGY